MPNYEPGENVSDEIDLKELFLTLWAYKYLIAALSIFVSIAAGIHALRAEKVYTASTIFSLGESTSSAGILGSLGGELGGLAALAGVKTDSPISILKMMSCSIATSQILKRLSGRLHLKRFWGCSRRQKIL